MAHVCGSVGVQGGGWMGRVVLVCFIRPISPVRASTG